MSAPPGARAPKGARNERNAAAAPNSPEHRRRARGLPRGRRPLPRHRHGAARHRRFPAGGLPDVGCALPAGDALAGGVVGLVLSTLGAVATCDRGPEFGPHWYPLALVVTALPCAWAGGRLRTRQLGEGRGEPPR